MEKLSPTLIVIILIAGLLLVSCGMAQTPEPSITPTEPKPTTIKAPEATSQPAQPTATATADPTLTPTITDVPALMDQLGELAVISAGIVDELVFIKAENIPHTEDMNFSDFDWSQDGALIVTCTYTSDSSSFQVYDLVAGSKLSEVEIDSDICDGFGWGESLLKFSRDGKTYFGVMRSVYDIGASGATQIGIFDSTTGEQISELEGLSKRPEQILSVYAAAFSSQGTRLAIIVNEDGIPASTQDASVAGGAWILPATLIELFDVESGEHWGSFHEQENIEGVDLEYSTDGEYLVFGVGDFAQAWSVDGVMTYEVECIYPRIIFSPTAEVAALTCGFRKGIYHLLWDLRSGDSQKLVEVPDEYQLLKFSPDGRLLIGLSDEGEVSIWHGVSGEYLFSLPDTYPTAVDAHFMADGKLVAVLLDDGSLKLYGVK